MLVFSVDAVEFCFGGEGSLVVEAVGYAGEEGGVAEDLLGGGGGCVSGFGVVGGGHEERWGGGVRGRRG